MSGRLAGALVRPTTDGRRGRRRGVTVLHDLTPREIELLHLLATEGLTNKHLAERLAIATSTVRTHLDHARIKLALK